MRHGNLMGTGLLAALLLTACGVLPGLGLPQAPEIEPTASLLTVTATETLATNTAVPATATQTLPPATHTPPSPAVIVDPHIIHFQMTDYLNGWAYSETHILHTADGGRTWHDITPPGIAEIGVQVRGSYFLDGSNAWLLLMHGPREASLYASRDGGLSWEIHPTPFTTGRLQFLNSQQGFAMTSLGAAAGSEAIAIFQTQDGGATWTQVYTNDPQAEGSADSLPFGGQKTGMTFLDASHGWVSGSIPMAGATTFYATQDGGLTWVDQELTLPPGFEQGATETGEVVFFTALDGLLPMRLFSQPESIVFYVTHDGGSTWTATFALNFSGKHAISSLLDIWLWDGSNSLIVSHDSGLTWERVITNLNPGNALLDLQFVDRTNGWALVNGEAGEHLFYLTADGGVTWELLIPGEQP